MIFVIGLLIAATVPHNSGKRYKAVEKLIGEGVKSEYLNDDKLGRVLDKIYKLGLTQLFVEIVLVVIKTFKIEIKYSHLDSTSFHLHGEYEEGETPEENEPIIKERPILIKRGYSRDHRPDLKQCVLDLIVNNQEGIPLFMRTGDGNESDKAVFAKILVEFQERMGLDSIWIGDSALYSQENLQLMEKLKNLVIQNFVEMVILSKSLRILGKDILIFKKSLVR